MRKLLFILGLLLFCGFPAYGSQDIRESATSEDVGSEVTPDFVPDELVVLFKKGTPESRIKEIHQSLDVQVVKTLLRGRVNLVKIPKETSFEELFEAYALFPEVQSVELNHEIRGMKDTP